MSELDLKGFPLRYSRNVLLLVLVAVGMGQTVLFAVLGPLGREIGLSEIQIGMIISASSIAVFLTVPFWGRRSDVWGRKKVMLIGMVGYAFGTVLFTAVLESAIQGAIAGTTMFVVLVVSRVLHACVMSATFPASSAYMADITDVGTRTKGMGAVGAANNIGAILGPAIGGALAIFSLTTPLWFAAVVIGVTALVTFLTLPEVPVRIIIGKPLPRLRYLDPRILPYLIVGVFMFMGFAIVQQTMAFRFQDSLGLTGIETARTFGLGMMLTAAASLFSQMILVQMLELKPLSLLRLAMPLLILAFLIMVFFETRTMLLTSMLVLGLGMGLAGPGFMAGASLAVSPDEQGSVAGLAGSCPPLGFTIGPIVGTLLYSISPQYPYIFATVIYIGLLVFVLLQRSK